MLCGWCWVPLGAAGCCWVLLDAAGCCSTAVAVLGGEGGGEGVVDVCSMQGRGVNVEMVCRACGVSASVVRVVCKQRGFAFGKK